MADHTCVIQPEKLSPTPLSGRIVLAGDRMLVLRHTVHNGRKLDPKTREDLLWHVHRLWGIRLNSTRARRSGGALSILRKILTARP